MYINPKFLLQLVEVVERGSLTEAAAALRLTQPALSRNVKELEAQIGASLLIRDRHGARLTELGKRAFPYAQALRTTLERISIEAESWQKGQVGSLQIGATPHPSSMMPKVLSDFLDSRPGVSASMAVSGILPLMESLANGELDLVVGPVGVESTPPGIAVKILFTDELSLFAGAGHPLVGKSKIDIEDLDTARWLGTPADSAMRRQVASILVSMGLTEIRYNIVVAGIENALDVLSVGDHVAILPKRPLRGATEKGAIVELPIELNMRQWPIAVFHHDVRDMPQLTLDFIDTLVRNFR